MSVTMHTNLLETIFAFSPSDKPRPTHRVPPGGRSSLSLADKKELEPAPRLHKPIPATTPSGAIDHIKFSEKDSIPHSMNYSPSKGLPTHAADTCGKYISGQQNRLPACEARPERRQSARSTQSCMRNVLDHETKPVHTRSNRVPPGGYQTFSFA